MAYHHDERGRGNKPYRQLWGGCTVDTLALHYPFAMTRQGWGSSPPALYKYHPYQEVGGRKKERKKEKGKRNETKKKRKERKIMEKKGKKGKKKKNKGKKGKEHSLASTRRIKGTSSPHLSC